LNQKEGNEKSIHNDKTDIIIGDNEKETCMLIDVAILRKNDIFAFSVKE
jgi:hypothetical protein